MFICNHCPYVKAVIDRIVRGARELKKFGVNSAAICSNDAASYPEDSFENMRAVAAQYGFPFLYLHDDASRAPMCFVRRHRAKTITSRAMEAEPLGGMKRIIIAGLTAAALAGYAAYCPVRRPERH